MHNNPGLPIWYGLRKLFVLTIKWKRSPNLRQPRVFSYHQKSSESNISRRPHFHIGTGERRKDLDSLNISPDRPAVYDVLHLVHDALDAIENISREKHGINIHEIRRADYSRREILALAVDYVRRLTTSFQLSNEDPFRSSGIAAYVSRQP